MRVLKPFRQSLMLLLTVLCNRPRPISRKLLQVRPPPPKECIAFKDSCIRENIPRIAALFVLNVIACTKRLCCQKRRARAIGLHALFIYLFIYLYMKPTHKTVYTVDIKKAQCVCRLIGNCRDKPLTQRRKSYNIGQR